LPGSTNGPNNGPVDSTNYYVIGPFTAQVYSPASNESLFWEMGNCLVSDVEVSKNSISVTTDGSASIVLGLRGISRLLISFRLLESYCPIHDRNGCHIYSGLPIG